MNVIFNGTILGIWLIFQGCGGVNNYSPGVVAKNTQNFGKKTEKIDKEINKGIKALRLKFDELLNNIVEIDLAAAIANLLDKSNLGKEKLITLLSDGNVTLEDQEKIVEEYDKLIDTIKSSKKDIINKAGESVEELEQNM